MSQATATREATATQVRPRRRRSSRNRNGPVFWIGMVILAGIFITPILWMFVTAFRSQSDSRRVPLKLIPDEITLRAFNFIFGETQTPVLIWALNSFIAATLHALLVLVVSSMAAYALARMEFKGRGLIFSVIVGTLFVPHFIFLMPNYLMMDRLGWLDTLLALIVPGAAGAFGVFFLRQFFIGIPRELEESALIDGANTWTILTKIILPLSRAPLVTLLVISFLANWNDFLWPVFVLFSPERLTLPPGLSTLQGAFATDYPVVMAGATIATIPVLILYVVLQRYIIEGVATSGLKG